jgi:hypothetical protein
MLRYTYIASRVYILLHIFNSREGNQNFVLHVVVHVIKCLQYVSALHTTVSKHAHT